MQAINRLPEWFKQKIPGVSVLERLGLLSDFKVNTVCQKARCPNLCSCFEENKLTFMILGDVCTRHCRFCAVEKSPHSQLQGEREDNDEPARIKQLVWQLGLDYVVVTSVTRDDLDDGGAGQFATTITAIHSIKGIKVEVLIPDFSAKTSSIKVVLDAGPQVVGHNLETVGRLNRRLRPDSSYERSLRVLRQIKKLAPMMLTKSSLMLGLGEDEHQLRETMADLRDVGCDILTLGQYLSPSQRHYPVKRFITPDEFKRYELMAAAMGFKAVCCGPKVRSSFGAEEVYKRAKMNNQKDE